MKDIKPSYRFGKIAALIGLIAGTTLDLVAIYTEQYHLIIIISIFAIAIVFKGLYGIKNDFTISGNFLITKFPKTKYNLAKDISDYSCKVQSSGRTFTNYTIFTLNFRDGKIYQISSDNMVNYKEIQIRILEIIEGMNHYKQEQNFKFVLNLLHIGPLPRGSHW